MTQRIIWTNHREYTEQDCRDSGFRDGRDGIRFYPCSEWEMTAGDNVSGNKSLAYDAYASGYREGRAAWRKYSGRFPQSGSCQFDAAILNEA